MPAAADLPRRLLVRLACALLALLIARSASSAPDPTVLEWARSTITAPASIDSSAAVVLARVRRIEVRSDGRMLVRERRLVRVQRREGRDLARVIVPYLTSVSRIRALRAWILRANGDPIEVVGRLDAAMPGADLIHESRLAVLDATEEVNPGDAFLSEWETDDSPPFLQRELPIGGTWRPVSDRVELLVPPRWFVVPFRFPSGAAEPAIENGVRVWTIRASDMDSDSGARLALSFHPPAPVGPAAFRDWKEVAAWLSAQGELPEAPAIEAKAMELTRGAHDAVTRIRALGEYVQSLRYVSIQTGLARGGGYRPRVPADVLDRGYGDCKDKAGLLVAFARALGMQAWLVAVHSGDRMRVAPEWPTPEQFNHCIAAVSVPDSTQEPAGADVPGFGRLLFVDATDPYTPIGQLPEAEQGALALIEAPAATHLVALPDPSDSLVLSDWLSEGELNERGELAVRVTGSQRGHLAAISRGIWHGATPAEREAWLARRLSVAPSDDVADRGSGPTPEGFRLAFTARLQRGQVLADGTMLVRLGAWCVPEAHPNPPDEDALERTASIVRQVDRIRLPNLLRPVHGPRDTLVTLRGLEYRRSTRYEPGALYVRREWRRSRVRLTASGLRDSLAADERRVRVLEQSAIWQLGSAAR